MSATTNPNEFYKFDLNGLIKVKLTEAGKDIYYHQFDELDTKGLALSPPPLMEDIDGFVTFQAWYFMSTFGPHLRYKDVIEDNVIYDFKEKKDDQT